ANDPLPAPRLGQIQGLFGPEPVDVGEPKGIRGEGEEADEEVPPLVEGPRAEILPIEAEEVEGDEAGPILVSLLEELEAGDAPLVEDGDLPIQDGIPDDERFERLDDARKTRAEIEPSPAQHGDPPAGDRR